MPSAMPLSLPPVYAYNDLMFRSVFSRRSVTGISSTSAIHTINHKDGLPLPLNKFELINIDTTDMFESCSYVTTPILIKYSKDIGKKYVAMN